MPKVVKLSELGAKFDGQTNDTEAWQEAVKIMNNNNGGVIVADGAGASIITEPLIPFKKHKTWVNIVGLGRATKLQFQGFVGSPCVSFEESTRDVENFLLRDISVRHTQGATLFQSISGRFKDSLIDNVFFGQASDSNYTAVEITGGLQSSLRDVTINGGNSGGTGLKFRGTHCELNKVFAPDKNTSPSNFIEARMVNGRIVNCRTEGGNGDFDYRIYDSDHVSINVYSEGHLSKTSILIENSSGVDISGAIGTQITDDPIGVLFSNASFCSIHNFKMSARFKNIVFDELSTNNSVEMRVIKTNFCTEKTDIFNSGVNNQYQLVYDGMVNSGTRMYKS